jgi:hypothetical protein
MYTVGLDVDKLVFTEKILLYAGNSWLSNPLVFIAFGKIYLYFTRQSAGNFSFSTKAQAVTKNTYIKYQELPKISEHVPKHNNFNDEESRLLRSATLRFARVWLFFSWINRRWRSPPPPPGRGNLRSARLIR